MVIPLDEYDKISAQMPKTNRGDQIELTEEDEAALDRAWAELRRKDEAAARRRKEELENGEKT